jgi:hypothetical protein
MTQTAESVEEVRGHVKELIGEGVLRWTDPIRGPDEYGEDERLPIELSAVPIYMATARQEEELLAYFGVSEEAKGRIVKLSPRSEVVCPMHERELRPDVCRSCRFLAGEA